MSQKISTIRFYNEYHGHLISDLEKLHKSLDDQQSTSEQQPPKQYIYLCGDSTLDNKYWFNVPDPTEYPAVNGYEQIQRVRKSRSHFKMKFY